MAIEPTIAGDHVRSRMDRYGDDAGREIVEGVVSVEFAAGARWGAAHLAFCPPLAAEPTIRVSAEDDIGSEIKVTHAGRYAARFDVRLSDRAEEAFSIRLRYRITTAGDGLSHQV
jgi:hypothetical protein